MRSVCLFVFSLSFFVVSACDKPEIDECRKACWNYNKVMFWDRVDNQVKGMTPQEAARIRRDAEVEYKEIQQRSEDPGLLNCITDCQHSATREAVECLQAAETPAKAESCRER